MLLEKPFFTVHLEMQNCPYSLELNGAMVHREKDGLPVTLDIPVNLWMRSGENKLDLLVLTFDGERPVTTETRCDVSLRVRPSGSPAAQALTVSRLVFSGKLASAGTGTEESTPAGSYDSKHQFLASKNGDVTISKTSVVPDPNEKETRLVSQTVVLQTPFPLWAFFNSDTLPDMGHMSEAEIDHYFKSIYIYIQRIHDALKSKRVDAILPMFEERSRETDLAYYKEPGTTTKDLAKELKKAVNDPHLEIFPVTEDTLATLTHENKKLIELSREDDLPAIIFNIKGGGSESYPITFRRHGDKWIITR